MSSTQSTMTSLTTQQGAVLTKQMVKRVGFEKCSTCTDLFSAGGHRNDVNEVEGEGDGGGEQLNLSFCTTNYER